MYYIQSEVKVSQPCLTLCDPMDYTVHGLLQARILKWIDFPLFRGSSQPRDWTQVSPLQAGSLPAEPQGSPRILKWVSLSLLQWIFPNQEPTQGLQHCRQTLCTIYKLGFNFFNIKLIIAHPILWKYKLIYKYPKYSLNVFFFGYWNNCQSSAQVKMLAVLFYSLVFSYSLYSITQP